MKMKNLGLISHWSEPQSSWIHECTVSYNFHSAWTEAMKSKGSISIFHESVVSESCVDSPSSSLFFQVLYIATKHLMFSNLLLGNCSFTVMCCNKNEISDLLLSNGLLLRLHHSDFQLSFHNIYDVVLHEAELTLLFTLPSFNATLTNNILWWLKK